MFLLLLETHSKHSWDWFWRKCSSWRKYCVLENPKQSKFPPLRAKGSSCFSEDALKFISSIYLLPGQLIPNLITGVHKVSTEEAAIAPFTNVINLFLIPPEWNRGLGFKIQNACISQQNDFSLSVHCSTEDFRMEHFSFTTFPNHWDVRERSIQTGILEVCGLLFLEMDLIALVWINYCDYLHTE